MFVHLVMQRHVDIHVDILLGQEDIFFACSLEGLQSSLMERAHVTLLFFLYLYFVNKIE